MTAGKGIIVNPSAVSQYGAAIGAQQGQLERIHAVLAGARLPGDAFGKLPEAGDLYSAYSAHATEVLDVTSRLPGQIGHVAQGLVSTSQSYSELESGMAEGIRSMFIHAGSGGGGGYSGSSTGGVLIGGFANILDDSRQGYQWIATPEEAIPPVAVQHLFPPSGFITGGIEAAVGWVLSHAPVLHTILDYVTGNVEVLKAAAGTWHDMGNQMNAVNREMKSSAQGLPEEWGGAASAAFGTFMGDVTQALSMLAATMGQTQQIIEEAAAEANFAHETVSMIISQVIEWVAGNIAVDVITAGTATAVEAPATAAFLADRIREAEAAASRLASVYRGLDRALKALHGISRDPAKSYSRSLK